MRQWIAACLREIAERIHNDDHSESVEIIDEYGVCRCFVELKADHAHGVNATFSELPTGWHFAVEGNQNAIRRPDPDRYRH